jgi:PEP-CTERM motif
MRKVVLRLVAGTALAVAVAQPAAAGPTLTGGISSIGYVYTSPGTDVSTATSLDFDTAAGTQTPGTPGVLSSYGSGSGSFAGVMCTTGSCGSIKDIASLVVGPMPISSFFILTGGNNSDPITFDLSAITGITRTAPSGGSNGFLDVTASGIFNWGNFAPTPGTFEFSTQGTNVTSFSISAQAVPLPEPATWALMLLGFGGIGLAMRRRRKPALAQLA